MQFPGPVARIVRAPCSHLARWPRLVLAHCQAAGQCLRCGEVAPNRPSGPRVSCQPPSWTARWWARQSRARLFRSVGPPWTRCWRWWASHQAKGRSQPGKAPPPSRTAKAIRWAGCTTRVARPTSRGWVGAPPRVGGSRAMAACRRRGSPCASLLGASPAQWSPLGSSPRSPLAPWSGSGWPLGGRVTRTRVTAPSQASRRHACGSSGPAHPRSPPIHPTGLARQAVHVHRHQQLGADPTRLGQPAPLQGPAGQLGQSVSGPLATNRVSSALWGRASGSNAASTVWPGSAYNSHPPPPCRPRSATATTPARMAAPGRPVGTLGINDLAQVGDGLAQPGWVQAGQPHPRTQPPPRNCGQRP
jgi:hypothetical protein